MDIKRFFGNHLIKTLMFLKLHKLGFNKFEMFLSSYGIDSAAEFQKNLNAKRINLQ